MTGAGRLSIARGMAGVALVAGVLAVLRHADPFVIAGYWGILAVAGWLIARKVVLAKPQQGFHYATLLAVLFASIYLAHEIARDRLRLLGPAVHWWQVTTGDLFLGPGPPRFLDAAEFGAGGLLGLLLAGAAGLLTWTVERRKGWNAAAFFRGAILGILVAALLLTLLDGIAPGTPYVARLGVAAACFVGGGWAGVARSKSDGVGVGRSA